VLKGAILKVNDRNHITLEMVTSENDTKAVRLLLLTAEMAANKENTRNMLMITLVQIS
jgi:hypothetical protein